MKLSDCLFCLREEEEKELEFLRREGAVMERGGEERGKEEEEEEEEKEEEEGEI